MWNNRSSYFLLLHIKKDQGIGWYIPIALPVIESVLGSCREAFDVWEVLFVRMLTRRIQPSILNGQRRSLSSFFALIIDMLKELHCHGQYELLHVENDGIKVSVRLW